jgi:hypothetical protein
LEDYANSEFDRNNGGFWVWKLDLTKMVWPGHPQLAGFSLLSSKGQAQDNPSPEMEYGVEILLAHLYPMASTPAIM